jgi:hypothetical protein
VDQCFAIETQWALRRKDARADIAEGILILRDGDIRFHMNNVWFEKISAPGRMDVEHRNDGDWCRERETKVVA